MKNTAIVKKHGKHGNWRKTRKTWLPCFRDFLLSLYISFVKYSPFAGGSRFIPTQRWTAAKHTVVNVQHFSDDKCFVWAILSAHFPLKNMRIYVSLFAVRERSSSNRPFIPNVAKKDCDLWNKWHWDYSQLLAFDEDSKSFVVLYLSPESHCRQHVVNLLLLDGVVQSTCDSVHHYVYTKAFVTSGF